MRHIFSALALIALAGTASAAPEPANKSVKGMVRVRLVTADGPIVLALDARRAPKTTANFLAYVDDGRLDNTTFYRAARSKTAPTYGFIQGGIGTDARRMLSAVPLEPTSRTGIKHTDTVISMAHGGNPDSATGNFAIMLGAHPSMDAGPNYPGYAAFGHVVAGMDVVRRILAKPIGAGSGPMKGQMILSPVRLIKAERIDGVAKPTGQVKPWLLGVKY
uniref:peptidylprolyl isomerase n=1 Tax=Sphingomonas bacterium TaxID=1895847 RepID=UPI002604019D|nr:peptidylprolyl isomerase [Sphingomonas bacterium]